MGKINGKARICPNCGKKEEVGKQWMAGISGDSYNCSRCGYLGPYLEVDEDDAEKVSADIAKKNKDKDLKDDV